ncbi:MAG: alkyl hydroperoxide reductase [Planctomycetota bacterium]|nr:MAG: alkyl hydroperoxide reductase [Planctomycetota bacterium]
MSIDALRAALPGYARDLRLNLSAVLQSQHLSEQQLWGTALAVASACRNGAVLAAVAAEARPRLSAAAFDAALAAASVMAMNNVYYRATHLLHDPEYGQMPARLRMQALGSPGVDKLDFELWCLAVSAVNGCGACLEAHAGTILHKGGSKPAVQDALRVAAVLAAAAVTVDSHRQLADAPTA